MRDMENQHSVHSRRALVTALLGVVLGACHGAEPIVPGRPEVFAQLAWAVERELAATVSDVMVRRTQLFFRDLDQGLGVLERVAVFMGRKLGWNADEAKRSADDYRAEVAKSRRWKA